jgi:DNA-binding transcriptional MerR regulator
MEEKYISITELAKLRKVSSETLRYYDRVNLLKPAYIDPQTRYRYYTIRQSEELGVIRELRDLGMSVQEIQSYLKDCNLQKSIKILAQYYTDLQDDVEKKLALCRNVAQKLAYLGGLTAVQELEAPRIRHMGERQLITFGEKAGGPNKHMYALTKLEGYLKDIAPVLATDSVGIYADSEILEENENYIYGVPVIFVTDEEIKPEADKIKRIIPEGDYLCMEYRGGRLEKYNPCFENIKKYMKNNRLAVSGPIFQIYKIDVTLTQDREETLLEIQVPVVKEGENAAMDQKSK